jgi:hypothetical protein
MTPIAYSNAYHMQNNACSEFFRKYGKGHGLWHIPDTRVYRDKYRNKYVITGMPEPMVKKNYFNTPLEAVIAFALHHGLWPEFVLWYAEQPQEVTDDHPVERSAVGR